MSKIQDKIQAKGYQIRMNLGWHNGEQKAVSFTAKKNGREYATAASLTALFKKL